MNYCIDCKYYTGEECDGLHEGTPVYDDTESCEGFELKEATNDRD